ncbi:MAG TPA: ADP-dependent glucokinase/phosphofructokinase [Streptosporangiaceae bacterium]|jgi:ADP-dependent phosphofructokinase/glucokinase
MTTATNVSWPDAYLRMAGHLAAGAAGARMILTGTSACVDEIFHIDTERLSRLAAPTVRPSGGEGTQGRELLDRVLARISRGRGGELLTRWPGGPAWVGELLGSPDRYQLGGTGPQASWALATVGAGSVLALADRSLEQLAVIDPRTGLCLDGQVVPAGSVRPSGTATKLPHCILEFTAGIATGTLTVPRSSRVILRFGDEPVERDEQFLAMTPALVPQAGSGLMSGLNGLADGDTSDRDWLAGLARAWSDAGLPVIHHELAEFPVPRRLHEAACLAHATSVGLSLSELFMLTGMRGDPRLLARDLAVSCGARRVIVHADDWALAVHRDDPWHTADVLLAGNAFAAARARAGQPAAVLEPASDATYTDDLPPSGTLDDGWQVTCVPAPHLRQPAGTVGLGDTFVAGVLLAESLPAGPTGPT